MQVRGVSRLKGISRLIFETSALVIVVAQAICWLSGWSLLGLLRIREDLSTQSPVTAGTRSFDLSPAIKVHPKHCRSQDRILRT